LLLLAASVLLVFIIAGFPHAPPACPPLVLPGQGNTTFPGVAPLSASTLISNNLKVGTLFDAQVLTRPFAGAWILASGNTGPSTIAGYSVELGAQWFLLQDLVFSSGDGVISLSLPIPAWPPLVGMEFVVQAAVMDPQTLELAWTNATLQQVAASYPSLLNVLVIRQGFAPSDAPYAPAQGDALVQMLSLQGMQVTVHDNVLPASVAGFDVILDARFNSPPAEWEKQVFKGFMRNQGGVFFLCGPFSGTTWSADRFAWIQDFLVNRLGLSLSLQPGGGSAAQSNERVDPGGNWNLLNVAYSIAGLPYQVSLEGGNFGSPGTQPVGTPWIVTSPGWNPMVYGMVFKPADITACPLKGGCAVLMNGGPDVFTPTATSPHPDQVFTNLCYWLDR